MQEEYFTLLAQRVAQEIAIKNREKQLELNN